MKKTVEKASKSFLIGLNPESRELVGKLFGCPNCLDKNFNGTECERCGFDIGLTGQAEEVKL